MDRWLAEVRSEVPFTVWAANFSDNLMRLEALHKIRYAIRATYVKVLQESTMKYLSQNHEWKNTGADLYVKRSNGKESNMYSHLREERTSVAVEEILEVSVEGGSE